MLATPKQSQRNHTSSLHSHPRVHPFSRNTHRLSSLVSSSSSSSMADMPSRYRGATDDMATAMQQQDDRHPHYHHHPHPSDAASSASPHSVSYYNGNTYTYAAASGPTVHPPSASMQATPSSQSRKRSRSTSAEQAMTNANNDGTKKSRPAALEKRPSQAGTAKVVEKDGTTTTVFQCSGYGDCNMTFTRSEHLARHVR